MNDTCCGEFRCRRRQPIQIQKGGLSGAWFAITRYKQEGTRIEAQEKHELHPLLCAALDVARNHWDEVLDLHEEREARKAAYRAARAAEAGESDG